MHELFVTMQQMTRLIWVHIWQSARKQKFSHAFSRRLNLTESIVQPFPETESDDNYSNGFSPMKQKNRLESNISVVFSKGDRIG